jgi:hypothetical protein
MMHCNKDTVFKVILSMATCGLFAGYFIPESTKTDCISEPLHQHLLIENICKPVRNISQELKIYSCGRGEEQMIARNKYGVILTFAEFLDLCKFNNSATSDDCIVVNNISNITSLFKCPDETYIIRNTATLFLTFTEMNRICN